MNEPSRINRVVTFILDKTVRSKSPRLEIDYVVSYLSKCSQPNLDVLVQFHIHLMLENSKLTPSEIFTHLINENTKREQKRLNIYKSIGKSL